MTVARYDAFADWYEEFIRGAWFYELATGPLLGLARDRRHGQAGSMSG